MLKERFAELQAALLQQLKEHYQARLKAAAVFGSVARERQRFDSDLDILVVCDPLPGGRLARMQEFMRIEDSLAPLLKNLKDSGIDTRISPVLKTPLELSQKSPLLLDMTEDAVILFDPHAILKDVLDSLRARLNQLGSKRVWRGNQWFWILKPNLRPGEVFEL